MMTDRPIIFSAPMICALLDGRKTMTRRLAWSHRRKEIATPGLAYHSVSKAAPSVWQSVKPGDRLWVKEAIHITDDYTKPSGDFAHLFGYEARGGQDREWIVPNIGRVQEFSEHLGGWGGRTSRLRSPIHMPRWASRLTLIVTGTKIERLQDINEEDAIAEGAFKRKDGYWTMDGELAAAGEGPARYAFRMFWSLLHGNDSWESNPEAVVLTFSVHRCNIDALGKEAA